MPRIRACGCGLRTVTPQSIPSACRSVAYANCPFTFGSASLRTSSSPTRPAHELDRRRACSCDPASGPRRCGRRRGSSRSRCSGRGCRPAPRGSRRPTASATRSSRSCAAITSPGVQKPHWTAPASTNASCTGSSRPSRRQPLDGDDAASLRLARPRRGTRRPARRRGRPSTNRTRPARRRPSSRAGRAARAAASAGSRTASGVSASRGVPLTSSEIFTRRPRPRSRPSPSRRRGARSTPTAWRR